MSPSRSGPGSATIGPMRVIRVLVAVGMLFCTTGAWAQSVYVGGAVAAEVVRTSSTKSGGTTYDNGSGEAFGGAIRVGTFITERVGVELEYFRPGEIDSEAGGPIYLAAAERAALSSSTGLYLPDSIFPSIISQSMRVRASTTSALLTARQSLGGRVELVYLGGVGFSRVVREVDFGFNRMGVPVPPTFPVS